MKSTSAAIKRVPEIIWYQVFKYFEIHEYVRLRLVSKKMLEYANHYAEIYEKECVRIFISELSLFE